MKINGRKFVTKEEKDKRRAAVLNMNFTPELGAKLDKAVKDAKETTDMLEEARKVPDELLHRRFDI